MQETNLLEVKDYIKTDPLMINLDTNIGSVIQMERKKKSHSLVRALDF